MEDPAITEILLKAGSHINAKNDNGATALMRAVGYGNIDVVRLLLQSGANVNMQNKLGHSALMRAAGQGKTETVKLLLRMGANPSLTTRADQRRKQGGISTSHKPGQTAADIAKERGHAAIAELLLRERRGKRRAVPDHDFDL